MPFLFEYPLLHFSPYPGNWWTLFHRTASWESVYPFTSPWFRVYNSVPPPLALDRGNGCTSTIALYPGIGAPPPLELHPGNGVSLSLVLHLGNWCTPPSQRILGICVYTPLVLHHGNLCSPFPRVGSWEGLAPATSTGYAQHFWLLIVTDLKLFDQISKNPMSKVCQFLRKYQDAVWSRGLEYVWSRGLKCICLALGSECTTVLTDIYSHMADS